MITTDTIIKAAKAAGLDVREDKRGARTHLMSIGSNTGVFDPLHNDTDNAMIMDGAGVGIKYVWGTTGRWVSARKGGLVCNVDIFGGNKAQARREAVILCAAEKFDAMQGVK